MKIKELWDSLGSLLAMGCPEEAPIEVRDSAGDLFTIAAPLAVISPDARETVIQLLLEEI